MCWLILFWRIPFLGQSGQSHLCPSTHSIKDNVPSHERKPSTPTWTSRLYCRVLHSRRTLTARLSSLLSEQDFDSCCLDPSEIPNSWPWVFPFSVCLIPSLLVESCLLTTVGVPRSNWWLLNMSNLVFTCFSLCPFRATLKSLPTIPAGLLFYIWVQCTDVSQCWTWTRSVQNKKTHTESDEENWFLMTFM